MKIQSTTTNARRYGIAFAGLMLALLAIGALAMGVSAADVSTVQDITLDDPANESIEVSLDFSSATDATVNLTDGTTVYDSTTVSGNATTSPVTATLGTGSASNGTYSIDVDSPNATAVSINSTTLVRSVPSIDVTDAANETLVVDTGFASASDATASVTVEDGTGTELFNDTLAYTASEHDDDQATLTREYNASDGLVAMTDGTVTVEYAPASAYEAAYATVDDGTDSGLFGGTIAGQDTEVALGGLLVLGLGGYYARQEDYI